MPNRQRKGGKKNRKVGRNAAWCLAYRNSGRRERNKARRLRRHLSAFPGDRIAEAGLARLR